MAKIFGAKSVKILDKISFEPKYCPWLISKREDFSRIALKSMIILTINHRLSMVICLRLAHQNNGLLTTVGLWDAMLVINQFCKGKPITRNASRDTRSGDPNNVISHNLLMKSVCFLKVFPRHQVHQCRQIRCQSQINIVPQVRRLSARWR